MFVKPSEKYQKQFNQWSLQLKDFNFDIIYI